MATVLPKETPLNDLPIQQSVNPTDYILISNGTLNLVPWSSIVISADQTDFYTSILSISAAQVVNTVDTATLSATVTDNLPNWNSTYNTVNSLSGAWTNTPNAILVLQGYTSNNTASYSGTGTQITGGIVVGFNYSYTNKFVEINNTGQQLINFTDNACLQFQPGTYRFTGSIKSTLRSSINGQYILLFFNSIPNVSNNKTYTISTAPVASIYSSIESNTLSLSSSNITCEHTFDSYAYISSVSYGLLLFVNNDDSTSTTTGVGVSNTLNVKNLGITPSYGGTLNVTYISESNPFNITSSSQASVVVRPGL